MLVLASTLRLFWGSLSTATEQSQHLAPCCRGNYPQLSKCPKVTSYLSPLSTQKLPPPPNKHEQHIANSVWPFQSVAHIFNKWALAQHIENTITLQKSQWGNNTKTSPCLMNKYDSLESSTSTSHQCSLSDNDFRWKILKKLKGTMDWTKLTVNKTQEYVKVEKEHIRQK